MSELDGWATHRREQRRAWQALTPAQRLSWLWQAKLFALRAQRASEERRRSEKTSLVKP